MTLRFTKMHGLGNDYVYVDAFAQSLDGVALPELARRISDRHRGVGGDGLILITPPSPGVEADVRMEMFNADGSRGEMCGNGIRCVAKYAIEHGLVQAAGPVEVHTRPAAAGVEVTVETDRGVLKLEALREDGLVRSVRVDMGAPILEPVRIPVRAHGERCVREPIEIGGVEFAMTCVSMGNPHAVFFVDGVEAIELGRLGPLIERHARFPSRVNVHFAKAASPTEARMRTWERGSGVTQACGTGACAVLVAGVLEDRLKRAATVHLPGGVLEIEWAESGHVLMTGPAEEAFTGEWLL
ncbi:MAG: diaminopimelate epimerase [Phycisphaerae bacterium]